MFDIVDFFNRALRVMNVFTRPKEKDFMRMAGVTAVGMVAIGIMGLVVSLIFKII